MTAEQWRRDYEERLRMRQEEQESRLGKWRYRDMKPEHQAGMALSVVTAGLLVVFVFACVMSVIFD